ncbi:MAG: HEAT repeat domain-containing protein [Acidobacteriota bacterium]
MTGWLDRPGEFVAIALAGLAVTLLVALLGLVLWRVVDELRFLRRQRLIARYRPQIDALLTSTSAPDAVERLVRAPRRHHRILADLILAALRLTTGAIVDRLREAAGTLGLVVRWKKSLHDHRWWVRAGAARALGLAREPSSLDGLLGALDDAHEEVRAAAVDALGRLGAVRSGPALLAQLPNETRHQRVRLVEAIRSIGPPVVPLLLAHARQQPSDAAMLADILGVVGASDAVATLLEWSGDTHPAVRAAALRALGSIGVDDRTFFYALRGLEDPDPDVRSMAARALGRSGRQEGVPYLAPHLDDEWIVAAHTATGLRRLGTPGTAALEMRAGSEGRGADLARQMLWELTFLKIGA